MTTPTPDAELKTTESAPQLQTTTNKLKEIATSLDDAGKGGNFIMYAYGMLGTNAVGLVNDAFAAHVLKSERDAALARVRELKAENEKLREALTELYTFPRVRDLLAPIESLGSIAAMVESALSPQGAKEAQGE